MATRVTGGKRKTRGNPGLHLILRKFSEQFQKLVRNERLGPPRPTREGGGRVEGMRPSREDYREHLMPKRRDTDVPPASPFPTPLIGALDRFPAAIACLDPGGTVRWASRQFHEMTAAGGGGAEGRSIVRLFEAAGARRETVARLRELLAGKRPGGVEISLPAPGVETRWLALSLTPDDPNGGEEPGWFVICHDVSRYIAEIGKRERERDDAETGDREQALRTTMIAHDIRGPVNDILGMARLLGGSGLGTAQSVYAEAIEESAEGLLSVVGGLLEAEHVAQGGIEVGPVPFRLSELVDSVGALLAACARDKNIELLAAIAPGTPDHLSGDPGRIRQMLYNLVINAIRFTERGGVEVTVRALDGAASRVTLRFEVTDTGAGIAEEELEALLSKSGDGGGAADRPADARRTGFGLAICRRLAHALGGELGARSGRGHGSTFWFTAPVTPQAGPQAGKGDGRNPRAPGLAGLSLLIAADSFEMRVLADQVSRFGAGVQTVEDANDCIPALDGAARADTPFDALVIDQAVPGTAGADLGKCVRRSTAHADLPMILVAAPDARIDPAGLRKMGFDACLTMPVTAFVLAEALRKIRSRCAPGEARALVTTTSIRASAPTGARVLLAEHDRISRVLALSVLMKVGYQVDAVVESTELVSAARATHYDLVVIDLEMPGLDRSGTITELCRLAEARARMPIIALGPGGARGDTRGDMKTMRSSAFAAGVTAYVDKPYAAEDLASAVRDGLRGADAGARWQPDPHPLVERRSAPYGPVIRMREAIAKDDLEALQSAARKLRRGDGGD